MTADKPRHRRPDLTFHLDIFAAPAQFRVVKAAPHDDADQAADSTQGTQSSSTAAQIGRRDGKGL
ncbi:hypothetical protein HYG77_35860 (plasmid) [Rhodococcus sp. ZPP]|uniref:hypothetical protein n=1 Tax=Rhodococcus TaxID=1827 RepID=UPI001AD85C8E|nr:MULTISPECIES: hypothetical protein [Rhodococcus]MBO8150730.1 hypothetical protein [Rhodococcus erythropolis]QTJ70908.1 hypothetical protein HYG77_35860 [Rhodococcus sp. ZPP]